MNLSKSILAAGCLTAACCALPSQAQSRLWGTYVGGFFDDSVNGVVTSTSGDVYVVGSTESSVGIVTPGGFDIVKAQLTVESGFLAKYDTNGNRIWGTFYGDEVPEPNSGISPEAELIDVKLDFAGNVYVVGNIKCPSQGLATPGAFQSQCNGGNDLYLAKFSPGGKRIWGTYYGGNGDESARAISVATTGVYLVASTGSSQGVVTIPSQDFSLGGVQDGLIAKFDLNGNKIWARYYGGEGNDTVSDIDCRANTCFVAGTTNSKTGIVTTGAHDLVLDQQDAFMAQIDGATGQRIWSSYFGGDGIDYGDRVIVDANLNVYLGGTTTSEHDIAPPNAFKPMLGGYSDNFLAKFDRNGVLKASTYFGEGIYNGAHAGDTDYLLDLAGDASGNIYALAVARPDNPFDFGPQATQNAFDKTIEWDEAVITKFDSSLKRVWGTYYGGSKEDMDWAHGGIAIGLDNHIHIGGWTASPDGIVTPGAHNTTLDQTDGFVVEFAQ